MTELVRPEAEFLLYQTEDGQTRVEVRLDSETAWLSLSQMAALFQRDKSVVSRHVKNVFDEGELDRSAVVARHATTAEDGKTHEVEYYNLDGHTAAEIVAARADATKPNMGMTSSAEKHLEETIREVKQLEKKRPRKGEGGKKR